MCACALTLFFLSALQFRALFWILGSVSCSASVRFCSLAERGFRGISALRFWVRIEVELEEEGMGGGLVRLILHRLDGFVRDSGRKEGPGGFACLGARLGNWKIFIAG